jgi:outer membrane immunogenic protein
MKKIYAAVVAVSTLAIGGPAIAADMALKAPPPPPAAYSWTGWYVGLNAGGSFGRAADSSTFFAPPIPFSSTSSNLDGFVGGGQIGYNWQSGTAVFGLEADIQGTSESGTANSSIPFVFPALAPPTTASLSDNEKLPWFGTVRGRIGITPSPTWLLYVTGGLAYGEIKSAETITIPGVGTAAGGFSTDRAGWTLGAGAEASIGGNWTAKIEYLYLDFGTFTNTLVTGLPVVNPLTLTTHVTDNIVRVGLNYRFH